MRGGGSKPNYDAASVERSVAMLKKAGQAPRVMIDFSHANSNKQFAQQKVVCAAVCDQLRGGDDRIIGVMIESNLVAGRQDLIPGGVLTYGQSITDACLGWDDSVTLLHELAAAVRAGILHAR